jgi:ubiquinone/menaquinone biosynthesis C-methylase UbiE
VDASGPAPLVKRARQALRRGQEQLALELTEITLHARPRHRAALRIRLRALERLANRSANGVECNIYHAAANQTRVRLQHPLYAEVAAQLASWKYAGSWFKSAPARPPSAGRGTRPHHAAKDRRLAGLVNQRYEGTMETTVMPDGAAAVGLTNRGYWTSQTRTSAEASDNLMELLLGYIPVKTGKLLDVAYGKGATTRHLLRYYQPSEVTAITISSSQLATAKQTAPGCTFLLMDATDLQFENESFDNVFCVEAAFHFASRQAFIAEAFRVLKPGGRLILSDILPRGGSRRLPPRRAASSAMTPAAYRRLYFRAGFGRLEIRDETEACIFGRLKYRLRAIQEALQNKELALAQFKRRKARIVARARRIGTYLIVCAEKPRSSLHSNAEVI